MPDGAGSTLWLVLWEWQSGNRFWSVHAPDDHRLWFWQSSGLAGLGLTPIAAVALAAPADGENADLLRQVRLRKHQPPAATAEQGRDI